MRRFRYLSKLVKPRNSKKKAPLSGSFFSLQALGQVWLQFLSLIWGFQASCTTTSVQNSSGLALRWKRIKRKFVQRVKFSGSTLFTEVSYPIKKLNSRVGASLNLYSRWRPCLPTFRWGGGSPCRPQRFRPSRCTALRQSGTACSAKGTGGRGKLYGILNLLRRLHSQTLSIPLKWVNDRSQTKVYSLVLPNWIIITETEKLTCNSCNFWQHYIEYLYA